MKIKLTERRVADLSPQAKAYEVRDEELTGFLVRVQPTGAKTFYLDYRLNGGRNRYNIGTTNKVTATQARRIASQKSADVVQGSRIDSVLESRAGLPIALAALLTHVAEGCGRAAEGIQ